MAEVDWAQWAIEAADGFRETKWQNIGVALRQLAHELISTRARLTTAETERDIAIEQRDNTLRRALDERAAAEARVEALSEALQRLGTAAAAEVSPKEGGNPEHGVEYWAAIEDNGYQVAVVLRRKAIAQAVLAARAALACPPEESPETLTEQVDRVGREFAAEVRSFACPPPEEEK